MKFDHFLDLGYKYFYRATFGLCGPKIGYLAAMLGVLLLMKLRAGGMMGWESRCVCVTLEQVYSVFMTV
jgi:hypothetical protein